MPTDTKRRTVINGKVLSEKEVAALLKRYGGKAKKKKFSSVPNEGQLTLDGAMVSESEIAAVVASEKEHAASIKRENAKPRKTPSAPKEDQLYIFDQNENVAETPSVKDVRKSRAQDASEEDS